MSYGIYISVSGGEGGTITAGTSVGHSWSNSSSSISGYTGFTGGCWFTAEADSGYEFVNFKIYIDSSNEKYTSGFHAVSPSANPYEIEDGETWAGSGSGIHVQAVFESTSSGGGSSSDTSWSWGDSLGEYTEASSGSASLSSYEVDYLTFTPSISGTYTITATASSSSDDLVLYCAEGGASWNDKTSPSSLVTWDDYADNTTSGSEVLELYLTAGTSYEFGWYEYSGSSATVSWSIEGGEYTSWQSPVNIINLSGSSYTSYSTTSTVNCYNAGRVRYYTPSYVGKLVIETTSGSTSPDYYSHLASTTLSAGSGTSRSSAVTGSILTSDDDGAAAGYDTLISYVCSASTYYYWYVNAAFSGSGTYSIPWKLNYYRQYSITYNTNGGSGTISSTLFYADSLSVTITSSTPTRSGYIFKGWSTSSTATSATYTAGATASLSAQNYTLYAVWQADTKTITYNANGGSGGPSSATVTNGTSYSIDTTTYPVRTNYIFKGWSTSSTATSATYKKDVSYTITVSANIILYAVWWPDFSWDLKNAEEANEFLALLNTYIGTTGASNISVGDIYKATWFNLLENILNKGTNISSGDLIKLEDFEDLLTRYKNY